MAAVGSCEEIEGNVHPKPRCGRYCSVPGCQAQSGSMFQFPQVPEIKQQWKEVCKIQRDISKWMVVCIKHFEKSDIILSRGGKKRLLRPGAIPCLELPAAVTKKFKSLNCVVHGCMNGTDDKKVKGEIKFHIFPVSFNRRLQWVNACKLNEIPGPKGAIVCSAHFKKEDYTSGAQAKLKVGAVPSLNLPSQRPPEGTSCSTKQYNIVKPCCVLSALNEEDGDNSDQGDGDREELVHDSDFASKLKSLPNLEDSVGDSEFLPIDLLDVQPEINLEEVGAAKEIMSAFLHTCFSSPGGDGNPILSLDLSDLRISPQKNSAPEVCTGDASSSSVTNTASHVSAQSDSSSMADSACQVTNTACHVSAQSDSSSMADSACQVDESQFPGYSKARKRWTVLDVIKTDQQMNSLIGVPCALLDKLTDLALMFVSIPPGSNFSLRERIALTLCKLKVNVSFEVLGVLFQAHRTTCGDHFKSTLHILYLILKSCIVWPSKEENAMNMPLCFKKYRDTRIVLDCTEIPVDTPNCFECRVRMYSHYKGRLTIKILVGVSPAGVIIFLSDCYGGRASDNKIFKESCLVSEGRLVPGSDAVMVDKGFRIDKYCTANHIKIHRPPFLKKGTSLSRAAALQNASIANARVHVERVIQRMKLWQILGDKLDWSMVPHIDEIMTVIGGLVNLSPPILASQRFLCEKDCVH